MGKSRAAHTRHAGEARGDCEGNFTRPRAPRATPIRSLIVTGPDAACPHSFDYAKPSRLRAIGQGADEIQCACRAAVPRFFRASPCILLEPAGFHRLLSLREPRHCTPGTSRLPTLRTECRRTRIPGSTPQPRHLHCSSRGSLPNSLRISLGSSANRRFTRFRKPRTYTCTGRAGQSTQRRAF